MILLGFAALGLIVGLLTGGSLRALAHYPLKALLLPIAAYALKAGAASCLRRRLTRSSSPSRNMRYCFCFLFSTSGGLFGRCLRLRARCSIFS